MIFRTIVGFVQGLFPLPHDPVVVVPPLGEWAARDDIAPMMDADVEHDHQNDGQALLRFKAMLQELCFLVEPAAIPLFPTTETIPVERANPTDDNLRSILVETQQNKCPSPIAGVLAEDNKENEGPQLNNCTFKDVHRDDLVVPINGSPFRATIENMSDKVEEEVAGEFDIPHAGLAGEAVPPKVIDLSEDDDPPTTPHLNSSARTQREDGTEDEAEEVQNFLNLRRSTRHRTPTNRFDAFLQADVELVDKLIHKRICVSTSEDPNGILYDLYGSVMQFVEAEGMYSVLFDTNERKLFDEDEIRSLVKYYNDNALERFDPSPLETAP
jgi:hypothetical protein